jgi:cell division protein FtsX
MTDRCLQHEKTIIGLEKFKRVSENLKNQVCVRVCVCVCVCVTLFLPLTCILLCVCVCVW